MKKVLFVIPSLRNGGGTIRGIQNMLSVLPQGKYDIHVLPMCYNDTDNIELSNCKVLNYNFLLSAITSIYAHTRGYKYRKSLLIFKLLINFLSKLKLRNSFENYIYKAVSSNYNGYDVVIGYQEGAPTIFTQYIKSKHKIAWIHCNYAEYHKTHGDEENVYGSFNHIVCVSEYTMKCFINIYPRLVNKSIYIHNILDKKFILEKSLDRITEINKSGLINLVSIGRIAEVKQFYLIPKIIHKMLELGVANFKWYIIGDGPEKEVDRILGQVQEYKIPKENFEILGPRFNPYPYIKNADILVSTSHSEACPFVVNEARVLSIPVVSTNYPSIYEFIKDGINGRICDINSMPEILSLLIKDEIQLDTLRNGMLKDTYDNDFIINQICKLLNN